MIHYAEDVCINGIEMHVKYTYTPEEKSILDLEPENCSPGEPEIIEIEKVLIDCSDSTELLNEYAFSLIKKEITSALGECRDRAR